MYTLKSIAQRGTTLSAVVALVMAAIAPTFMAAPAFADNSLNPLTKRSLTLSSSSPGWAYTDGSGNSTYAPPNSGTNGKKSGETFSFNTTTDSTSTNGLSAFTLQYCTSAAGICTAPGNDASATPAGSDDASHSDLNVVAATPTELSAATYAALATNSQTSTDPNNPSDTTTYTGAPNVDNSQGNFVVLVNGVVNAGWSMSATNNEDGQSTGTTGKNNYITLTNSTTPIATPPNTNIKIIFYGTNTNYITNPGAGAFFVKINDYKSATTQDGTTLVDGGVTVANVMNQSIQITTKVLETMDFSVGTINPDTLTDTQLATASGGAYTEHGTCNNVLGSMTGPTAADFNVLSMGDANSENALSTQHTYSTHSYWRLSSNSSAGATVYYSGNTLANTEGDTIDPIGVTAKAPQAGESQFGLALDNGGAGPNAVNFATEAIAGEVYEQGADGNVAGVDSSFGTDLTGNPSANQNQLAPLAPTAAYGGGTGNNNTDYAADDSAVSTNITPTAKYAFDANSLTVPVPIAQEASTVVNCVTAKMRYVANISAITPAGIYTTKINYIAAPEY